MSPKPWWWSFEMVRKGAGVHLGEWELGVVRQWRQKRDEAS